MVSSASGLLAAGNTQTALRALVYLAASQEEEGGFPQNFRLDGEAYWHGIQLDEVAFPILLVRHLDRFRDTLCHFDPYPLILRAAGYLVRHGPVTEQERWEEASGYSPSTLAATIAALLCAASLARDSGQVAEAEFLEDHADFIESHLEEWTVTTESTLLPGLPRHYMRLHPLCA